MGARYDNPARFIKRAGERPKKLTLPEPEQFDEFIVEIQQGGGRFSRSSADLVCFLAYGGFRKTEAAHVTWNDLNFDKGEIVVRGDPVTGTKNNEVRRVPMIAEMRLLLERLREKRVNADANQPVMEIRECQMAMTRAAEEIKIPRITHHDLRHLFATRCIESGVDIPSVSRWLGHKDGGALAMKVYGPSVTRIRARWPKKSASRFQPPPSPPTLHRSPRRPRLKKERVPVLRPTPTASRRRTDRGFNPNSEMGMGSARGPRAGLGGPPKPACPSSNFPPRTKK